jgi:hypothetical protein
MLAIVSCKKNDVCCINNNRWPVANAGRDTIIVSPTDRMILDGSASFDPDGNIVMYKWSPIQTFISGSYPTIRDTSAKQTEVANLRWGIYRFELMVKDNKGAFSRDTVTVQVEDKVYPPHPVGFYPWLYSGLAWNPSSTELMVVGPVPGWQFNDFAEDNDGSKWKVQLLQQATVTNFLPYVKHDDIRSFYPIFYSIWDLVVIVQGDNPVGSVYVFANPTLTSGIDFTKTVDIIIYVKF